jgi:uncharacterized protein
VSRRADRVDAIVSRIYTVSMHFSWDEKKREANLQAHGFDFVDAENVFFVTLGFLNGVTVSIVHTETEDEIRIISFRKATTKEEGILFENLQN